ncbi:DUF192 domain-containing protein [Candidatus Pacearchaeota archaeon]|nr:DUF192 domain-containing protein [Candidatus Pacearchaeota archaeon]
MVKINIGKRSLEIDAKKVASLGMFSGLMFRSKNTKNLLFEFSKPKRAAIHSLFVFFPFAALWLDDKNNLVDSHYVEPFTLSVSPKRPARRLIELPTNKKNKYILRLLDDKERFKYKRL